MVKRDNKANTKVVKGTEEKSTQKTRQFKKISEYGKQLAEKQKVKEMYGMRERQFRKFFKEAKGNGNNLLSLLERRLDNVAFRLKFCCSRAQARQMIVHGHFSINGKRVYSPSILVKNNDVISVVERSLNKETVKKDIIEKYFAMGTKVPGWLELDTAGIFGRILRMPERTDIQATINEGYIVELYSK